MQTIFGSSLPPVVMSFLRYLCLLAHSDVQYILRVLLCAVSTVSLDCPFWISPSVFSYVYLAMYVIRGESPTG
jgi:hypothetical protein